MDGTQGAPPRKLFSVSDYDLERQLPASAYTIIINIGTTDIGIQRDFNIPFYKRQSFQHLGDRQNDVPIFLEGPLYKPYWQSEIKQSINAINEVAPGLNLYLTTDEDRAKITITEEDGNSAYTKGNIVSRDKVLINLGSKAESLKSREKRQSTATHELLHALGAQHEHQRRDAGSFMSYTGTDEYSQRMKSQYATKDKFYGLTGFDPNSIMMYSECRLSRKDDAYIWTLKPDKERRGEMSELDKVGLNLLHRPTRTSKYNPNNKGSFWSPHVYARIYSSGRSFRRQDGTQDTCTDSDGGPTCPACRVLQSPPLDALVAKGKWQGWTGKVYCGKKFSEPRDLGNGWRHDGYCGPNNGDQCPSCKAEKLYIPDDEL